MAAATKARSVTQRGTSGADRPGLASILAGTKWYRGTVIVGHGSRMMAYPTGGFNNANTPAAGGPLQVAGADGNGGLRLIAKQPSVSAVLSQSGAGTAVTSVAVVDTGTGLRVEVTSNLSATAAAVQSAMLGNAQVAGLVDVGFTGTGLGVSGALAETAVPFVRLLGLANGDIDASADLTDQTIENPHDYPYTVRRGVLGLVPDAAMSVPATKYIVDNQTITENYAALLLPIFCDEIDDGLGFCRFE